MSLERVVATLFIIFSLFAAFLFIKLENNKYGMIQDQNRSEQVAILDDLFKDELTLWWPGISGVEPRYFGQKGMKGLGWEEFPVYKIKNALKKDYGVRIVDWMVSPSRLDYEFKANRRPICIYPYKWKDPEREFKGERTQLLSYALDFGGETSYSILIRKDSLNQFIDYLDQKGDLILEKVVKNHELKTAIIKGEDYDQEIRQTYKLTANGEWQIKTSFSQIYLMVASDNSQLLKMLQAKRIDYVLDQLITLDHYKKTDIDPEEFKKLVYRQSRVSDANDPNLVRYSIRCNRHPHNLRLMPTINQFASWDWKERNYWVSHHRKFEPLVTDEQGLGHRLKGDKTWWFKQYKMAEGFKEILPKKGPVKTNLDISITQNRLFIDQNKELEFKVFRKGDRLAIIDPGFVSGMTRNPRRVNRAILLFSQYDPIWAGEHITSQTREMLKSVLPQTMKISELLKGDFVGIKHFTLVSPALKTQYVTKLLNQLKNLRGLHIILPHSFLNKEIFKYLQPSLTELTLARFELIDQKIHKFLNKANLSYLDLSASMMSPKDLQQILEDQHNTLSTLKLDFMYGEITDKLTQVFADKSWKKIKILSLAGNHGLANERTNRIVSGLGDRLEELILDESPVSDGNIRSLVDRCPNLKKLVTGYVSIKSPITLPENLQGLNVVLDMRVNGFRVIQIPKRIKELSIKAEGKIKDDDLIFLKENLGSDLESLTLKGSIDNKADMNGFIKGLVSKKLQKLNLVNMKITDQILKTISERFPDLKVLELPNNLLSEGSSTFFKNFKNLEVLELSNNLLSSKGIIDILKHKNIKSKVKSLHIERLLEMDAMELSKHFPDQLLDLSIRGYEFWNEEAIVLFHGFPETVKNIYMTVFLEDKRALSQFIHVLPRHLELLANAYVFDGDANYLDFFRSLPKSLYHLNVGIYPQKIEQGEIILPQSLQNLNIWFGGRSVNRKGLEIIQDQILKNVPLGISSLHIYMKMSDSMEIKLDQIPRIKTSDSSFFNNADFISHSKIPAGHFFKTLNKNISRYYAFIKKKETAGQPSEEDQVKPKYIEDSRLSRLMLYGAGIDDEFADILVQYNLSEVMNLELSNTNLTAQGIIKILRNISSEAYAIQLLGSKIDLKDVERVIQALPPRVMLLNVSGSNFGQKGYQKFREWQEMRAQSGQMFKPIFIGN